MRRWLVIPCFLVFGLLVGTALADHIYTCSGSTAWHWGSLPIVYQVNASDSVGRPYRTAWITKVDQWDSLTTCVNTQRIQTADPEDEDVTLYANFYGFTGWLGLTEPIVWGPDCH